MRICRPRWQNRKGVARMRTSSPQYARRRCEPLCTDQRSLDVRQRSRNGIRNGKSLWTGFARTLLIYKFSLLLLCFPKLTLHDYILGKRCHNVQTTLVLTQPNHNPAGTFRQRCVLAGLCHFILILILMVDSARPRLGHSALVVCWRVACCLAVSGWMSMLLSWQLCVPGCVQGSGWSPMFTT